MSKLRQYGFIPGLIIGIGLTIFYSWNWYAEAKLHQVVRVHFIAHSDRPADQRLKLEVRDRVLAVVTPGVQSAGSREEVVGYIRSHLPLIKKTAEDEVRRHGYHYPVRVALADCEYGWRNSGGVIFSPGAYTSLTVTIGQGSGHNWWGVLYPPFGLVSADNQHGGQELRFKLWDMACQIKSKNTKP